jgi:hypothetical protein
MNKVQPLKKGEAMKKLVLILVVLALTPVLASAQSSGSFSYGTGNTGTTACALVSTSGAITGGQQCSQSTGDTGFTCTTNADCTTIFGSNSGATCNLNSVTGTSTCALPPNAGDCIGKASAGLKTNSGNGNVFDIRPSAVIGLLTDVTVGSKQGGTTQSSSALAGIDFQVTVKGANGQKDPSLTPSGYVTYDARFVQISTNLFTALSTLCSVTTNPLLTNGCFLTFAESTVSAHSFDWIAGGPTGSGVPLSTGQYNVTVDWKPSLAVTGISRALACVGPVNLTVSQNKIFSFNTVNGL